MGMQWEFELKRDESALQVIFFAASIIHLNAIRAVILSAILVATALVPARNVVQCWGRSAK